jgi:CDP-paratose synthetase
LPGQKPKALLTGATGFLGSHVAQMLFDKGFELVIIKRENSSIERLSNISEHVSFLNNNNELFNELSHFNFDYFFHMATCYGRNGEAESEIIEVNQNFPTSILNSLEIKPILINFGTSLPSSVNIYAKSKNEFVKSTTRDFPVLKLVNLKLEHFFGPDDGKFINFIINSIQNEVDEIPLTEGTQIRDFIYYKDLLSALELILDNGICGDIPIGSGNPYVLRNLVESIKDLITDSKTKLSWGKVSHRDSEVMKSVADISKLKRLGWKPKYSFEQGIQEILKGYKS